MAEFMTPFCMRHAVNNKGSGTAATATATGPNDFGHYFVELGVIVVRDQRLYVYEHEEWEVDGALAASRLQLDLESADAIECRRFKSGSNNYNGGRVTITGIDDSRNGDAGSGGGSGGCSGGGSGAANNDADADAGAGAGALERITFLFEYETYKAIRPILRPFMQVQVDNVGNLDSVDSTPATATATATAPAAESYQQPWLVRTRRALLPLIIFFVRVLLFTSRALLLAVATAVHTLWLEFCRHFNNWR